MSICVFVKFERLWERARHVCDNCVCAWGERRGGGGKRKRERERTTAETVIPFSCDL